MDIHKGVAATGHDTQLVKADDNVYKALPECCLHRNQHGAPDEQPYFIFVKKQIMFYL
jgi:hypothetical protein